MHRLLIAGTSGLLGSNLAVMSRGKFKVQAIYHKHAVFFPDCECLKADFACQAEVETLDSRPDIIINCIALTDVDYCEEYPDEAYKANVVTVENLLDACRHLKPF